VIRGAACFAAAALVAAAALGETVTSENGYRVTRSQTVVPVPAGLVGRKTIDRETRTRDTEQTEGNASNFTMTLGGFLHRCPVPEGNPVKFVVAGDFEYAVVVDAEGRHHEKRMTARIKVFVNDDLSVTEGEIDGQFSSDIDGVRTGPVRLQRRFPIRAYGTPDFDALLEAVTVTGDLAAGALMWSASTAILDAQRTWREPNACAELEFEPASETRAVSQGETVEIRVKYKTRDGQLPIPKGSWDAAVEQGGQVPQATGPVQQDGTFTVRYLARASGTPKAGDGARIEAISAGGYARDTWKIRVGGEYELHFESDVVSRDPVEAARARRGPRATDRLRQAVAAPAGWQELPPVRRHREHPGHDAAGTRARRVRSADLGFEHERAQSRGQLHPDHAAARGERRAATRQGRGHRRLHALAQRRDGNEHGDGQLRVRAWRRQPAAILVVVVHDRPRRERGRHQPPERLGIRRPGRDRCQEDPAQLLSRRMRRRTLRLHTARSPAPMRRKTCLSRTS
jgi:hypothetical protein